MLVAGCAVAGALVEERPVELPRCAAAHSLFCNWYRHGTSYRMARATSCRGAGRSMVLHIFGAVFNSRTRDLLLRRETFLAGQARFYLPALEHRLAFFQPVAISTKRRRNRDNALVCATASGERSTSGAVIFYGHALSSAWFFQCLSFSVFLRCRPLSISRQRRVDRLGQCWFESFTSICAGAHSRAARFPDLAPGRYLSRLRDIVA